MLSCEKEVGRAGTIASNVPHCPTHLVDLDLGIVQKFELLFKPSKLGQVLSINIRGDVSFQ